MTEDKLFDILNEAEFKPGGMVWKHITSGRSDPLVAVRSADRRSRHVHKWQLSLVLPPRISYHKRVFIERCC